MKQKINIFKIGKTLLVMALLLNINSTISAQYTANPKIINVGTSNLPDAPAILTMACTTGGSSVDFLITNTDGSSFSNSGVMILYVKQNGSTTFTIAATINVIAGSNYVQLSQTNLSSLDNNVFPLQYKAQYNYSNSTYWANVGYIYITKTAQPLPTVSLISPNSGTFQVGQTMNIQWSSTNQDHHGIYLYKGGTSEANQIATIDLTNYNNDGNLKYYNWTIQPTVTNGTVRTLNGNDYKIKIVVWNSDGVAIGAYSSNYFTINPLSSNISISPSTLTLDNTNIGQSSATKYFTITNTGTSALNVSSIGFSSPFFGSGFTSGTINPGALKQVGVTFTPQSTGTVTRDITVYSDASSGNNKITITGTGVSGTSVNHNPNNPSFISPLPSGTVYQVNVASFIPVKNNADPDGDATEVRLWSANSNYTQNYPYKTPPSNVAGSYNIPITFTQAGSQIVYIQAFDSKGAYSQPPVSKTINVQEASLQETIPEIVSQSANQEIAIGGTIDLFVNATGGNLSYQWKREGVNIYDNLKITGAQTNALKISNIEKTDFGRFSCIVTNTKGTKYSTDIYITEKSGEGINYIKLNEFFSVFADKITQTNANEYILSGNASVNHTLYFSKDITVDKSKLTIEGDCRIFQKDIPVNGIVKEMSYLDGLFKYQVDYDILKFDILFLPLNFDLGGLSVEINNITFLQDGISINGKLEIPVPKSIGKITTEITDVRITKSQGIQLAGKIAVRDFVDYKYFNLEELSLKFNTIQNNYDGKAIIEILKNKIEVELGIKKNELDKIKIMYIPNKAIPVFSTGWSLKGVGGGIEDLTNPPFTIGINGVFVPSASAALNSEIFKKDIIKLDDVNLKYKWGTFNVSGGGALKIFDEEVANASFEINNEYFLIKSEVDLAEIIKGDAAFALYYAKDEFSVEGKISCRVQLPPVDSEIWKNDFGKPNLVAQILDGAPGIGLPYVLLNSEAYLKNTAIAGNFSVLKYLNFNFLLAWDGEKFTREFGRNWRNWNEELGLVVIKEKSGIESKHDRFEGYSVKIKNIHNYNKGTNSGNSFSFNLIKSTPAIIYRVISKDKQTGLEIQMPNGIIVNASNIHQYPNIEYFTKDTIGFYAVSNPEPGLWNISADDPDALFDVFAEDLKGSFKIESIEKTNDNLIKIKWLDYAPDENAKISLYYDTDDTGNNGYPIVQNISEDDLLNEYLWDCSKVKTGKFYIYAVMEMNSGNYYSYFSEPIEIISPNAAYEPINLTASNYDNYISLQWINTNSGNVKFIVYYTDNEEDPSYDSKSFACGSENSFDIYSLTPGRKYKFAVTAINEEDNESKLSNIAVIDYISKTLNNSPFINNEFPENIISGSKLNLNFTATDYDNDNLIFTLTKSPAGALMQQNGNLSWLSTDDYLGKNQFSVKVEDGKGGADSVTFYISVLKTDYKPEIKTNKDVYYCKEDVVTVTVSDFSKTGSSQSLDITVKSITNNQGKTIKCTPNGYGDFTASFKISDEQLSIINNDYITIEYFDSNNTIQTHYIPFFDKSINLQITETDLGGSILLDAGSGYSSYLWHNGKTSQTNIIDKDEEFYVIVSNEFGCRASEGISLSGSLNKIDKTKLNVFPNPTNDLVYLTFDKEIDFKDININLVSINGSKVPVKYTLLNNSIELNVSSLAQGMYIGSVLLQNEVIKFKIFKN